MIPQIEENFDVYLCTTSILLWLLWAYLAIPIKMKTWNYVKLWSLSLQNKNAKITLLFPWMSTHKKKINFETQLFLEISFWIITLKYFQAWAWLTKPIWNTWIIFFYFRGHLTSIKKLTSYRNSLFIHWKLIILMYLEHAPAYLNTPNLNT